MQFFPVCSQHAVGPVQRVSLSPGHAASLQTEYVQVGAAI